MNFDEEDDVDEISSSSSQLNSNTRPGSATSKKSCKVKEISQQTSILRRSVYLETRSSGLCLGMANSENREV